MQEVMKAQTNFENVPNKICNVDVVVGFVVVLLMDGM